ncbi:MAG: sigma-70 family RNA polymerase sigma factor [Phycisphaerales bacterium]
MSTLLDPDDSLASADFAGMEDAFGFGEDPDPSPSEWVELHGDMLFGYAMRRLRHRAKAEDVVQETLLAALTAPYDGRADRGAWLMGILRRRIADGFRRAGRRPRETGLETFVEEQYAASGKWSVKPRKGPPGPDARGAAENEELRMRLADCLDRLPARTAEAFLLVEHASTPPEPAADLLGVTRGHLHVILYRARTALRLCLEGTPG